MCDMNLLGISSEITWKFLLLELIKQMVLGAKNSVETYSAIVVALHQAPFPVHPLCHYGLKLQAAVMRTVR